MNQMFSGEVKSLVDAVTQTALSYRLLSQYTSFVAVSEEVRVNPDGGKVTVEVPVELPQGVNLGAVSGEIADALKPSTSRSAPVPSQAFVTSGKLQGEPILRLNPSAPFTGKDQLNTRLRNEASSNTPADTSKVSNQTAIPNIQVTSITGLVGADIATVKQAIALQLQAIKIPNGFSGIVILEMPIQNGRLTRFVLDDLDSTLKDRTFVELLKRSLQNVVLPSTAQGTIRLSLLVSS